MERDHLERLGFFFLAGYENRHMDPDPALYNSILVHCSSASELVIDIFLQPQAVLLR